MPAIFKTREKELHRPYSSSFFRSSETSLKDFGRGARCNLRNGRAAALHNVLQKQTGSAGAVLQRGKENPQRMPRHGWDCIATHDGSRANRSKRRKRSCCPHARENVLRMCLPRHVYIPIWSLNRRMPLNPQQYPPPSLAMKTRKATKPGFSTLSDSSPFLCSGGAVPGRTDAQALSVERFL